MHCWTGVERDYAKKVLFGSKGTQFFFFLPFLPGFHLTMYSCLGNSFSLSCSTLLLAVTRR
jgi:hypothetical protein